RLRDMQRAIDAHRAILAFDPDFLRSYRVIAEIYLEQESWRHAADALLGVIKRARDEKLLGRTWFQLAEVYDQRLDDVEKAVAAYRRALEYLPEHTDALTQLATVYERTGSYKHTIRTLQRLAQIERIPLKRKEVLLKLCELLVSHFEDFDAAEEVLVTAREIDPGAISTTQYLAEIYRKRGRPEPRETFLRNSFSESRDRFHADVSRPSPLKAM